MIFEWWRVGFRILIRMIFGREGRTRFFTKVHWNDSSTMIVTSIIHPLCRFFRSPKLMRLVPHEKKVQKVLQSLSGSLFVDVGANIGIYTTLLCQQFTKIIAIEPDPMTFDKLTHLLDPFKDNITFIKKAISNKNGYTSFCVDGRALQNGPLIHSTRQHFSIEQQVRLWEKKEITPIKIISVETTTLSKLLGEESDIDLVKVDVEGAEWEVIQGAQAIMPRIRMWMIEVHNPSENDLWEKTMQEYGYQIVWLDRIIGNHLFAFRN